MHDFLHCTLSDLAVYRTRLCMTWVYCCYSPSTAYFPCTAPVTPCAFCYKTMPSLCTWALSSWVARNSCTERSPGMDWIHLKPRDSGGTSFLLRGFWWIPGMTGLNSRDQFPTLEINQWKDTDAYWIVYLQEQPNKEEATKMTSYELQMNGWGCQYICLCPKEH